MSDNLSDCSICGGTAQFTDSAPGANPVSYCSNCLPAHLQPEAAAGRMPLSVEGTTVADLREAAKELDVEGRSSMNKEELAEAVSDAAAEQLAEESAGLTEVAPVPAEPTAAGLPVKKASPKRK